MTVHRTRRGLSTLDEGSGRPVLLLHPLALGGEWWRPLVDHLSAHARVLAPDARGHGGSDWDHRPFTVDDMAEDYADLIEEFDLGPVGLAGMSMGGCAAIALSARHPELVRRLVLADTTASYGPEGMRNWEERARTVVSKPREEQITFQLDRWFSRPFRERDPAEVHRVVELFLATDSAAHAAACRALGEFDGTGLLSSISSPTLVIVGEDDYATPPEMAGALRDGLPQSRLRVVPGARHMSLLEAPAEWRLITDHLGGDGD